MKMSTVADQADDQVLRLLSSTDVLKLTMEYQKKYGGLPKPDEEASAEQLSALYMKIQAKVPPYADFAVFAQNMRERMKLSRYYDLVWPDFLELFSRIHFLIV